MIYLIVGCALLCLLVLAARSFVSANPAVLARQLRIGGGVVLLLLAGLLAVTGRFFLAIPAFGLAWALLGSAGIGSGGYKPGKASGQRSRVRTAMVEMELDHDTGDMSGTILAGSFQGQTLDDLSDSDLKVLWAETAQDDQSRKLVEAYLDRRLPSWREDFEADGAERQGSAASSGPMTDEEAYQILGLSSDAGDAEIRAAHRRLMMRVHPDQGGSGFLAAKINEAKDTLLRRH
ncbi:molecular chaperone DnaJ [Roseibium denhamense]|uniref:DnaJ domain-containing protein n=1 Tax=Roseibium denhamense TaxID=76305 RepID=A0ABY1PG23_9HYPH|nr:DnaJ domain-containing protein [Roseibium denhamense]MTI04087.1 molecular chaperone DnaJ [Roseibium denhamense]SMP33606.1 DnaJ domain-containing protein [Roseibium denhamense]